MSGNYILIKCSLFFWIPPAHLGFGEEVISPGGLHIYLTNSKIKARISFGKERTRTGLFSLAVCQGSLEAIWKIPFALWRDVEVADDTGCLGSGVGIHVARTEERHRCEGIGAKGQIWADFQVTHNSKQRCNQWESSSRVYQQQAIPRDVSGVSWDAQMGHRLPETDFQRLTYHHSQESKTTLDWRYKGPSPSSCEHETLPHTPRLSLERKRM